MRLPVVDAWNFTVEHQFSPSIVLSVAYVGNHGYHVTAGGTNYNINQPTIVGFGTLNTNQRRYFYNQFGWTQSIKYFSDDASVKFNSLQVRGEKRFANGLMFQGNFTWASAFDFANDYFLWNHNIDYGRESGVRRFVFNLNNVYELPFGRGRKYLNAASRPVDAVLGGWQLSNIWLWESGIPFTPSYLDCGKDEDTGPCRATLVGSASVPNPGPQGWFATATPGTSGNGCLHTATPTAELNTNGCTRGPWTRPAAGTFGYVARNSFFGPHASTWTPPEQEVPDQRAIPRAVPRRVVQRVQPREPGAAQRDSRLADRRTDHEHRSTDPDAQVAARIPAKLLK